MIKLTLIHLNKLRMVYLLKDKAVDTKKRKNNNRNDNFSFPLNI